MRPLTGYLFFTAIAMTSAPTQVMRSPNGCYIATPAFTYSGTGQRERGDSSWSFVQLLKNGSARRPLRHASDDRRSKWTMHGDTLRLLLADGLVGWDAVLYATGTGWTGKATYLTDAVTGHYTPNGFFELKRRAQQSTMLTRRACARPPR